MIPGYEASSPRWLLLVHQVPPKPAYFRVKIRRHLLSIGAVALKSTVYLLPRTGQTLVDFQWVLHEIVQQGGSAALCEAHFVGGLTDEQIVSTFQATREADYHRLIAAARRLIDAPPTRGQQQMPMALEITRLKRRFEGMVALDFFSAAGREAAEGLITDLETHADPQSKGNPQTGLSSGVSPDPGKPG